MSFQNWKSYGHNFLACTNDVQTLTQTYNLTSLNEIVTFVPQKSPFKLK